MKQSFVCKSQEKGPFGMPNKSRMLFTMITAPERRSAENDVTFD